MGLDWKLTVTVDKPDIFISSGSIDFTAQFDGFYYIFYRWPLISFVLATGICFFPIVTTLLAMFYIVFQNYIFTKPIKSNTEGNGTEQHMMDEHNNDNNDGNNN